MASSSLQRPMRERHEREPRRASELPEVLRLLETRGADAVTLHRSHTKPFHTEHGQRPVRGIGTS